MVSRGNRETDITDTCNVLELGVHCTLLRHRPLTIAVGMHPATSFTAALIWSSQGNQSNDQNIIFWWFGARNKEMKEWRTHCIRHECRVGIIDDGGERPVVVQEHYDLLSFGGSHELLKLTQSRWMPHLLQRNMTINNREIRPFCVKGRTQLNYKRLRSMLSAHSVLALWWAPRQRWPQPSRGWERKLSSTPATSWSSSQGARPEKGASS